MASTGAALLALLMLLASGGCVVTAPLSISKGDKGDDVPTEITDARQVASALAGRRVVFVGETHSRYDHHLIQLEALKALHRQDTQLAIGVEWFQQPFQPVLDDYIAGRIDEKTLLKRSEWFSRWRFDYRLYRPIMRYARAHRIPVIALNAPVELTDAVREQGLNNLGPTLASQLPGTIDHSDSEYAADLKRSFEQHPGSHQRSIGRFIDVQLTWDESMAERAALYLKAHPQQRMIIFAGSGHLQHGRGIPQRLKRRTGLDYLIVLPADGPVDEPGLADIIVLTEPRKLPPTGLLGLFLEDSDEGVRIVGIGENSGAADAGLQKGDVILAVDGQPTPTFSDIKLQLLDHQPGDVVAVRYRTRDGDGKTAERTTQVTLS